MLKKYSVHLGDPLDSQSGDNQENTNILLASQNSMLMQAGSIVKEAKFGGRDVILMSKIQLLMSIKIPKGNNAFDYTLGKTCNTVNWISLSK